MGLVLGHAISTAALWGAKALAPTPAYVLQLEKVIDSAVAPSGLTPMVLAGDASKLIEALCADSDVTLLELAQRQGRDCAGAMLSLIENAETVADAIRTILMFNCLHAEPMYWTGSMRGDHAALTGWFDRPGNMTVQQAERMVVLGTLQLVSGLTDVLGESFRPFLIRIKPTQVSTDWPDHFMGVPIDGTATETELLIDRECLSRASPNRRAQIGDANVLEMRERYQEEAAVALLKNDTCSWIRSHLPLGDCDLTHLASRLNCDKRTLQRRFEKHLSCRFSDLVDEVRAEMCLPLLEGGVFPTQVIAEQLGYATSGNFSRFFQRRFGCTPRDWTRLSLDS
jgi:AraC-like DNA-binding protein